MRNRRGKFRRAIETALDRIAGAFFSRHDRVERAFHDIYLAETPRVQALAGSVLTFDTERAGIPLFRQRRNDLLAIIRTSAVQCFSTNAFPNLPIEQHKRCADGVRHAFVRQE